MEMAEKIKKEKTNWHKSQKREKERAENLSDEVMV